VVFELEGGAINLRFSGDYSALLFAEHAVFEYGAGVDADQCGALGDHVLLSTLLQGLAFRTVRSGQISTINLLGTDRRRRANDAYKKILHYCTGCALHLGAVLFQV